MVRRIYSQYPPKKVVRAMLPSGREVKIYWTDDHVIVHVGAEQPEGRTQTLPIKSFPLFGRPLAQRIREAVILLDTFPQDERVPDEVEQAVEQALFHGGIIEESAHSTRREPPLVSRRPPPPEPTPTRGG